MPCTTRFDNDPYIIAHCCFDLGRGVSSRVGTCTCTRDEINQNNSVVMFHIYIYMLKSN